MRSFLAETTDYTWFSKMYSNIFYSRYDYWEMGVTEGEIDGGEIGVVTWEIFKVGDSLDLFETREDKELKLIVRMQWELAHFYVAAC